MNNDNKDRQQTNPSKKNSDIIYDPDLDAESDSENHQRSVIGNDNNNEDVETLFNSVEDSANVVKTSSSALLSESILERPSSNLKSLPVLLRASIVEELPSNFKTLSGSLFAKKLAPASKFAFKKEEDCQIYQGGKDETSVLASFQSVVSTPDSSSDDKLLKSVKLFAPQSKMSPEERRHISIIAKPRLRTIGFNINNPSDKRVSAKHYSPIRRDDALFKRDSAKKENGYTTKPRNIQHSLSIVTQPIYSEKPSSPLFRGSLSVLMGDRKDVEESVFSGENPANVVNTCGSLQLKSKPISLLSASSESIKFDISEASIPTSSSRNIDFDVNNSSCKELSTEYSLHNIGEPDLFKWAAPKEESENTNKPRIIQHSSSVVPEPIYSQSPPSTFFTSALSASLANMKNTDNLNKANTESNEMNSCNEMNASP